MGLEELLGKRGMRPGLEAGLGGLLMAALASKMGDGPSCGGPEEAGMERNCDECPREGNCPMEAMKRAMGEMDESGACSADGIKDADLLMALAKITGLKAQVELLENYLTQFRERVDKMAAAHKAEVKRLTERREREAESLRGVIDRTQEQVGEAYGELDVFQGKISAVQDILLNGHARPRDILAALRRELGMPPAKRKAAAAPAAPDKAESAGE
jgi:hypothetical protein